MDAIVQLVESPGAKVVSIVCLMELMGLKGRKRFEGYDVRSVIKYPGK